MSQLFLNHSSQFHQALRTQSVFPVSFKIGGYFLVFSLVIMIGLLSFLYLVKFTEIHTKGYQLRKLEIQKDHLIGAKQGKMTDIARLKSLQSIRESALASQMVPAQQVVFFKPDPNIAQASYEASAKYGFVTKNTNSVRKF